MQVIKVTPNVRAGLYARISLDRTGARLGVARQEADCRALADRLGWEVTGVFVDNDLSASSGKRRPGYDALLAGIEAGTLDAVVTYHPDRLTRRPVELEHLIEVLDTAGAKVATVAGGDYDLGTASGRMVARIIGATARAEAERIGERVARKKLELAEAGLPPGGGMRPYGYERDGVTIRPAEADALRKAAEMMLAGESYGKAARMLNEAGMVRDTGPWTGLALRQVLTGWRVAGVRTYRGEVVGPAAWPAILDAATHSGLRDLAEMRRRAPMRRVAYLLSGVGVCGACGARLYRRTERDGRSVYYCAPRTGCGGVGMTQASVDPYVVNEVRARLSRPFTPREVETDDGRLQEVEGRLVELASRHASGDLTDGEWSALRAPLRAELRDLRQRTRAVSIDVGEVAAVWDDADDALRNVLLRHLGATVTIHPVGRGTVVPPCERVVVVVPQN